MSIPENNPELHIDLIDPGIYLKAADLRGKVVVLTVKDAWIEEMENKDGEAEDKLILSFGETDRQFVVVKTNRVAFSLICGEKRAAMWKGKKISIAPHVINAFGDPNMECIRVVNDKNQVYRIKRSVRGWVSRKWSK